MSRMPKLGVLRKSQSKDAGRGKGLTVDAAVTGALFEISRSGNLDLLISLVLTWCTGLRDTWDDYAVADEALDEPVIFTLAVDALVDAPLTEIKVAILANAAVIVLVWNSLATMVAVDTEGATEVSEAGNCWLT
jgi:hypothetical protein